MYLTGDTPPDGANINQIAAHEYGHHIASWRVNSPWDALDWGPKRWATAAQVCRNTRQGLMVPGDENLRYEDNPGEIWAETYRVYASSQIGVTPDPWTDIMREIWRPTGAELAAAGADIATPWTAQRTRTLSGKFKASGAQSFITSFASTLDGRIDAASSTKGGLKVSVSATATKGGLQTLGGSTGAHLLANACGSGSVTLTVKRISGAGSWTLKTQDPGT